MESDEELFYDSLDEEFFSSTISNDQESVPSEEDRTLEADSVPLYEREIPKNDLSKTKCKKCFSRSDYFILDKGNFTSRSKNSYLSLFRSRTKRKSNSIPGQETDRATDGDTTDRFSFCSGFNEAVEHCCEFKDCVNDQNYEDCMYNVSQVSLDTGMSQLSELQSVSQQHLTATPKMFSKTKTHTVTPILGSLGPNIDPKKLELLQRKQNYGMKVSQKNRIKFREKQVLQNLKKEIENCRENRKKELDDKIQLQSHPDPTSTSSTSSVLL